MKSGMSLGFLLLVAIIPDLQIKNLLDNFARLKSSEELSPYVQPLRLLAGHKYRLFAIITELHHTWSSDYSMPLPTSTWTSNLEA
jgi:hypothetical protein